VATRWFIWANRNAIREEGRGRSGEDLAHAIRSYAYESKIPQQTQPPQMMSSKIQWSKPPIGVLKLNCDASVVKETMEGSWGFLIRDHDGDVIMSRRGRINHALSAFQAKLVACLQGIQVATNLGIGRLILETDALLVQQALTS